MMRSQKPALLSGTSERAPDGHLRALAYAHAAASQLSRVSREASAIVSWAIEFDAVFGLGIPSSIQDNWQGRFSKQTPDASTWRSVVTSIRNKAIRQLPVASRGRMLARAIGLDPVETAILQLGIDYTGSSPCERLWDTIAEVRMGPPAFSADFGLIALLIGRSPTQVQRRLQSDSTLLTSGVLNWRDRKALEVLSRLNQLSQPSKRGTPRATLLGSPRQASLPLEAFQHLGNDIDRIVALLRGAVEQNIPGIHVMLYGPPGTGKTELAATLATAIGVALHSVGETDDRGGEPSRGERLRDFQLAQRLLSRGDPAVLLFDEAEDLFTGDNESDHSSHAGSRAFVHRLLEQGRAPVIWTSNSLKEFPQPVLRRMACCLELRVPPEPVRRRLWKEVASEEGVALPEADVARMAKTLPVAPALARSALRAARLAGGGADTVRWALSGVARAMSGGLDPVADTANTDVFDPRLMTADRDLAGLADRLAKPGASRRVSLLLSGPPGSGKSAYARHLAERMGLPVMQRRSSDLLGAYVGETEKAIASAFSAARADGAFLIFDEADSLLGDRREAVRSWEVSMVNEMLTWMEQHPLPFCCTTNLAERLDPAIARRLLVKAKFGWLTPQQTALAFETHFGMSAPRSLLELRQLTPADFDLVRRQLSVGEISGDPEILVAALEREQMAKPGVTAPLGFRLAS